MNRGCSEQGCSVPSHSYSFPWPSAKPGHTKEFVLHQIFGCPPSSVFQWPAALELFLLQFLLLSVLLWIGNFTCEVSASRSAWRPWDPLKFSLKNKRKKKSHLNEYLIAGESGPRRWDLEVQVVIVSAFEGHLEPELLTAGWKMQSRDLWSLS